MIHLSPIAASRRLLSRTPTIAVVAGLLAGLAVAPRPSAAETVAGPDMRRAQTFACGSAGKMKALFSTDAGAFRAYVMWPDQPVRTLNVQPATGEPLVAWSDGPRTLVWSPGVQLTWTDRADASAVHCSRDGGHDHKAPPTPAAPSAPAPDHSQHEGHGI